MKTHDTTQEIAYYASLAKSLTGEITVNRLISELKIGHQKAKLIYEKILSTAALVEGVAMDLTPPNIPSEIRSSIPCTLPPKELPQSYIDAHSEPQFEESVFVKDEAILVNEDKELAVVKSDKIDNLACAFCGELHPCSCREQSELAVVNAGKIDNLGLGLGMVLKQFDCGNLNQLVCTEDTKDTDLGMAITVLCGLKDFSEFGIGDAINELKKRGYPNAVAQIASHLNREDEYQTFARYAHVAEIYPPDKRNLPGLSFTHYAESGCPRYDKDSVKNREKALEVLTKASEGSLNTQQTRAEAKLAQGKTTTPTPLPAPPKPGFILIDKEALLKGKIVIWSSHKEPLCNESALCISMDNLDYAGECHGESGLHLWLPIPLKDETEPVKESELEIVE